jgi:tRNA-5-methyluridine54 2-sulfurtransferase
MAKEKSIEDRVKKTIKDYKLLNKKEKILVACSGGKDSTTILYLLHKWGYNVEAMMIDLLIGKWSDKNLLNVKKFCKEQGIKLNIVSIRKEMGYSICYIRSCIQAKAKLNNCTICGVIKRWLLNKKARELGAKKLVTGHNLDDEAESVLMNIFKGNPMLCSGLGPVAMAEGRRFVPRVKPLYFCTNSEIKEYAVAKGFPVLYEPCPCSEGAYRKEIRAIINEAEKDEPFIRQNIVKGFLKILPRLKKMKSNEKLILCKSCGEPAAKEQCRKCEMMSLLGGGR